MTLHKNPPSLVTVAMSDKPCYSHTFISRSENYIDEKRENRQHADRQDKAGNTWYETRSQLTNFVTFFKWLFNVLYAFQAAHEPIVFFNIYLKHGINMNEHQNIFYLIHGKISNAHSLSPTKLIYSTIWLVCQTKFSVMIGQITCQSVCLQRIN